jgi:hypothetical protein
VNRFTMGRAGVRRTGTGFGGFGFDGSGGLF